MEIDRSKELEKLYSQIASCKLCALSETRNNTVPGEGNPESTILLIGEGPGAEEDEQGRPFVGRSGKLLTKILGSANFSRSSVYITNVVKCRPPENRNPKEREISSCSKYLEAQIAIINPSVLVTVGSIATKAVLGDLGKGITKIRGQFFDWNGVKVVPILHPSYLLRNPSLEEGKPKWNTWQDMLKVKKYVDSLKGA